MDEAAFAKSERDMVFPPTLGILLLNHELDPSKNWTDMIVKG